MIKLTERMHLGNFESALDFARVELSNYHLIKDHRFNTLHSGKDFFILPLKKRPVKRRISAFNQANHNFNHSK